MTADPRGGPIAGAPVPDAAPGIVDVRGAGPVGIAFALFLLRQGVPAAQVRIGLGDARVPDSVGGRTIALSHGSWQLLARICALPPAAPIRDVEVSLRGHAGRTRLESRAMAVPALGQVTRYRDLHRVLHDAASRAGLGRPDDDHGTPPACTVHAEGRIDTGDARERDFGQSAVLAELDTGHRDTGIAYERFTDEGPLAMLPLPERGRFGLVWCGSPDATAQRMAMAPESFLAALSERLGPRFGTLSLATQRVSAPLARRARRALAADREVWIGNAAQALHPVAGQGFNLGLRDAFTLARALGAPGVLSARPGQGAADDARAAGDADGGGDGVPAALARYARDRAPDRRLLLGLTDTLASVFTLPALRPAQSLALALLDLAPPLRNGLAARLMYGAR